MMKRHLQMVVSLLLASGLTACGGGSGGSLPGVRGTVSAPLSTTHNVSTLAALRQTSSGPASYTAIDAGGGASGNWIADTGYSGGYLASVTSPINTIHVVNPAPVAVYQTQRYAANFSYTVPNLTPNGSYTIRLHFVESFFNAAQNRIFDVKINGTQVLTNFDIFQAAGGQNIAIAQQFAATADASGKITIVLTASKNNAAIAGIEISAASSTPTPVPTSSADIAIDAGGAATGNWIADIGFNGGAVSTVTNSINTSFASNPAPQSVYQSQRYAGHLVYTIPNLARNGAYTLRMHFAETFFAGAGQRVFNVVVNNTQVLTNFDIFQASGGANIAIVKQFSSSADSAGTITVQLIGVANNASLAGIEIIGGSSSPPPTPTPSPSPTPTGGGGSNYPNAGWVPFTYGPMVTSVASMYSSNPSMVSNSANIINNLWGPNKSNMGLLQMVLGGTSYWRSVFGSGTGQKVTESFFISKASDPVYTVSCNAYPTACNYGIVHIPANAMPATDSDHHMVIRDTATGLDWQFWLATIPSGSGGTFVAGTANSESSATGEGIGVGGTASNVNTGAWAVRPEDVLAGRIPHALAIEVTCDVSTDGNRSGAYVYPAIKNPVDGAVTDNAFYCGTNIGFQYPNNSQSNVNLEYGSHLWLDLPNSSIPPVSGSCDPISRAYLRALNEFGAYVTDVGGFGNPIMVLAASDLNDTYNGGASKWQQVFNQIAGYNYGQGSAFQFSPNSCGIDLTQHLHVLTPPTPN